MWRCTVCGTENSSSSKSCRRCRQPKPEPRKAGKGALLAACAAALALVIAGTAAFTGRETDRPEAAGRAGGPLYYASALSAAASDNKCGRNAYWTLENGTLTVSGKGAIEDYTGGTESSWHGRCDEIKKVIIKDGITSIGLGAFYDCENLTAVTIPDGVTEIGSLAFEDCDGLTGIKIPASVTKIGAFAFLGCDKLTIEAPAGSYAWRYAAYRGILSNSTKSAANVCGEKAYWTLEKGTLTISGSGAMDDFGVLGVAPVPTDIMTPWDAHLDEIKRVVIENGITSVGGWAFNACENLTGITLPKSVTKIGDEAFRDCKSLTDITIPEGVTKIGVRAFAGCESLTGLTIPKGVTEIGDETFYGCKSLTGITIPASVKKIGANAFTRCDRLTIDAPAGSYAQNYAVENGIRTGEADREIYYQFLKSDGWMQAIEAVDWGFNSPDLNSLDMLKDDFFTKFYLYDIDADGIEELVVNPEYAIGESYYMVFSYNPDNESVYLITNGSFQGGFSVYAHSGSGTLRLSAHHQDFAMEKFIRIKDGSYVDETEYTMPENDLSEAAGELNKDYVQLEPHGITDVEWLHTEDAGRLQKPNSTSLTQEETIEIGLPYCPVTVPAYWEGNVSVKEGGLGSYTVFLPSLGLGEDDWLFTITVDPTITSVDGLNGYEVVYLGDWSGGIYYARLNFDLLYDALEGKVTVTETEDAIMDDVPAIIYSAKVDESYAQDLQ